MGKCVLAEINALDDGNGCYARNEWLADFFDSSEKSISNMISNLRAKGYFDSWTFDGRDRVLKVRSSLELNEEVETCDPDDEPKPVFTGVWVPVDVWMSEKLSWEDKCILAEIHSLDDGNGCHASNAYLGGKFGMSESSMANRISKLRKNDFIIDVGFDGRKRRINLWEYSDGHCRQDAANCPAKVRSSRVKCADYFRTTAFVRGAMCAANREILSATKNTDSSAAKSRSRRSPNRRRSGKRKTNMSEGNESAILAKIADLPREWQMLILSLEKIHSKVAMTSEVNGRHLRRQVPVPGSLSTRRDQGLRRDDDSRSMADPRRAPVLQPALRAVTF